MSFLAWLIAWYVLCCFCQTTVLSVSEKECHTGYLAVNDKCAALVRIEYEGDYPTQQQLSCGGMKKGRAAKVDWSNYRKISNISRTKSENLIFSRLVLQLFVPNPLKPGVKSRMKM